MKKAESIGMSRRRLIAVAGVSAGATLLSGRALIADEGRIGATMVSAAPNPKNTSFGSLKQVDAGLLSIGYAEAGPAMVVW